MKSKLIAFTKFLQKSYSHLTIISYIKYLFFIASRLSYACFNRVDNAHYKTSALLHNASTLVISLKSMTNLIPEEKAQKALAEKN